MEKTCLHRFCGDCQGCEVDYKPITPEHPLNNYSCKRYCEIHFGTFEVVELTLREQINLTINQALFERRDRFLEEKVE
jgi:hypothetical protein